MRLKTLKDLEKESDELSFGGYTIDTLKQEAIKWVRWIRKEANKIGKENRIPKELREPHVNNIGLTFMEFFNITEKDLK